MWCLPALRVLMAMADMSPSGRKFDGLVSKVDADWDPAVQQMAEDESVGAPEDRKDLCAKVVRVFKEQLYWDSPGLSTKVMAANKQGKVAVTKKVKVGIDEVDRPDPQAEALVEHVLEMLVVLKSDTVKRKLFAADSAQLASPVKRASLNRGLSALEMSCVRAAGDGNNNVVMETAMDYAAGEGAKLNFAEVMKKAQMHSEGGKKSADVPWYAIPGKAVLSC